MRWGSWRARVWDICVTLQCANEHVYTHSFTDSVYARHKRYRKRGLISKELTHRVKSKRVNKINEALQDRVGARDAGARCRQMVRRGSGSRVETKIWVEQWRRALRRTERRGERQERDRCMKHWGCSGKEGHCLRFTDKDLKKVCLCQEKPKQG